MLHRAQLSRLMTKKFSWLKADEARYDNLLKIMLDNVVSPSISIKDLQKKLEFMLIIMVTMIQVMTLA